MALVCITSIYVRTLVTAFLRYQKLYKACLAHSQQGGIEYVRFCCGSSKISASASNANQVRSLSWSVHCGWSDELTSCFKRSS